MRRRALLGALGTAAIGIVYLARHSIAPRGRITRRAVLARVGSADQVTILRELVVDGDPPEVVIEVHEAFRDALAVDGPNTVDSALAERLRSRFEDGVEYRVQQYCRSTDSGDVRCGRARLSREGFNRTLAAADARLLRLSRNRAVVLEAEPAPTTVEYRAHPSGND